MRRDAWQEVILWKDDRARVTSNDDRTIDLGLVKAARRVELLAEVVQRIIRLDSCLVDSCQRVVRAASVKWSLQVAERWVVDFQTGPFIVVFKSDNISVISQSIIFTDKLRLGSHGVSVWYISKATALNSDLSTVVFTSTDCVFKIRAYSVHVFFKISLAIPDLLIINQSLKLIDLIVAQVVLVDITPQIWLAQIREWIFYDRATSMQILKGGWWESNFSTSAAQSH